MEVEISRQDRLRDNEERDLCDFIYKKLKRFFDENEIVYLPRNIELYLLEN